jgi:hypothetical protein
MAFLGAQHVAPQLARAQKCIEQFFPNPKK